MAGGWEHLVKKERLRVMGFITLSGAGEEGGARRWVLGGGDTSRINGKRGGSGWTEQRILTGDSWEGLEQGSEGWLDLSLEIFQELAGQSPVQRGLNLVFTLLRAEGWAEELRSIPAQVTLCFTSRCRLGFPMRSFIRARSYLFFHARYLT